MSKFLSLFLLILVSNLSYAYQVGDYATHNWGIMNGRANSHVDAADAWAIMRSQRKVSVAVIDTGIDLRNSEFGKLIDPASWDFRNKAPLKADYEGHGTHVSGIIEAVSDLRASLLGLKFYSEGNSGSENLAYTINAVRYAIRQKVQIINYSGGGAQYSSDEYEALNDADKAGILVVAAAGNAGKDTNLMENFFFPASYQLPNIISVAATDIENNLSKHSNWGSDNVSVAAPGESIYSTLPNNAYGYMTGTSQATAFVTGIATLILSEYPQLMPEQVKKIIMDSVEKVPALRWRVASGGRVDAYKALILAKKSANLTKRH